MNLLTRAASALSFAHLAGIGKAKSAQAEDDDKKKRDGESDDDYAKRMKAAEDDDGDEKDKEKKDAKADDSGESEDAKAEDEEPEDKEKKDGKKSKKAADEEDDDDDKEMRGTSPAAAARRRERARCAAIFADRAAARNPQLAAELAFNTAMPRSEALAVLRAAPTTAASAPAGGDRASRNPQLGPGGTQQRSSAQHVEASWDRAFAKVAPKSARG